MNCTYCGKELKLKGASHQTYCKKNPNKKIVNRSGKNNPNFGNVGTNHFVKAKEVGKEIKVSEETRIKLSKAGKGRRYTEEEKKKRSEIMKRVVRENPESYSASNVNGRSKKIFYNGFWLDSQWEYEFAVWCDNNYIQWEKNKKSFEYEWQGKRLYYPDFYLNEYDRYVEIKGYERDRDKAKWSVVTNLIIVKLKEINEIRNNKYRLVL